ncbi:hypothetical protein SPRG_10368 [Saprolegnia parasitica CBS 223.65]|uniref:Proteasome assembly chaperone 4 n=1 Tax=Saprolegnia parasitica (strain CBS 223.65) TaxID=695850 RepID=A0A067C1Z4_SAPPC|nr:hypothetical protein SPRG_10368 [Saprolegnia parasitica CBS 223.65]KDO24553.1 hypothetical protein SPRG_10368 [Saprolegnia parasitica CBS 223.65]|eukprot:XP_012204814.1 hypothetical protein SPRG_10368 [Saprolegnia parasitica CBS 223.65]
MADQVATMMDGLHVAKDPAATDGARIINFSSKFVDQAFSVQLWLLEHACFVWIGLASDAAALGSLSTAIKTPYDPFPLAASLLGGHGDEAEAQIAQRLVLKTKKQVFVSCNLPDDPELAAFVERAIMTRLRDEAFV